VNQSSRFTSRFEEGAIEIKKRIVEWHRARGRLYKTEANWRRLNNDDDAKLRAMIKSDCHFEAAEQIETMKVET